MDHLYETLDYYHNMHNCLLIDSKCLVPGYSITCRVTFLPNEPRYYEDCIRVHTEDHENQLIIPIYAYPVIGDFEFPDFIELQPTAIGQKRTLHIPIKSSSAVDFEFRIQIIQMHPSFTIHPVKGVLHAGQITKLRIDFQPTAYTTCELKFELHVAQVNFKAKVCTIIGNAAPGIPEDLSITCKEEISHLMDPLDTQDNFSQELSVKKYPYKLMKLKCSSQKLQILKKRNISEKLPEMTCPHHLVKFLLGSYDKMNSSQRSNKITSGELNRQQKLLAFEAMVHQNFIDEQRNQVRWQSKLGETPLLLEERLKICQMRELAWNKYYATCTHPEVLEQISSLSSVDMTSNRNNQLLLSSSVYDFRPCRPVDPFMKSIVNQGRLLTEPKFHLVEFSKAKWLYRVDIISKFRSIVSSVIIKQRMIKRLKKLKQTSTLSSSTIDDKNSGMNLIFIRFEVT
ncbi:unnamed protein product [Trichobilharzia szidati]|nr:unnamed protein product [Trichobilharzia szidati]